MELEEKGLCPCPPLPGNPARPVLTRVCDGILSAIGDTPLIRLRRLLPEARFDLFAKLEALNPGGSIKDRPALSILEDAIRSGAVGPWTVANQRKVRDARRQPSRPDCGRRTGLPAGSSHPARLAA